MWSNLTAIAQKAKEAAARIESEINNSIGFGEIGPTEKDDTEAPESAHNSDGWDKCDAPSNDVAITDSSPKANKKETVISKEISFVDLKAAVEDIPCTNQHRKSDNERVVVPAGMDDFPSNDEPTTDNLALADALKRISSFEQHVRSLRDELASAHNTTLQLQNKIQDLEEQNKRLKESGEK